VPAAESGWQTWKRAEEGLCAVWLGLIKKNKISFRLTLKPHRRVPLLSTLLEMEQRVKIQ